MKNVYNNIYVLWQVIINLIWPLSNIDLKGKVKNIYLS